MSHATKKYLRTIILKGRSSIRPEMAGEQCRFGMKEGVLRTFTYGLQILQGQVFCLPHRPLGSQQSFVCLFGFLTSRLLLGYIADVSQDWRLTILSAATHETEWGDHDFCLSRSHYADTDPTSRERAATVGIKLSGSWIVSRVKDVIKQCN